MCGIAGIIDLTGQRNVPRDAVRAMAQTLYHRGPDEDGFLDAPHLSFASRRLSIVGLADGQQPIFNEDRTVGVVFNGELFDYPEERADLAAHGHVLRTHTDTEIVPHRWEDLREKMFDRLKGQFAFALWDSKTQTIILARDRFGIAPLYWTRQTRDGQDWLVFASEIKGILASGLVDLQPDVRGINQIFTFFGMPGPRTCFQGIDLLQPGHYIKVQLGAANGPQVSEHIYWEMDFPDHGDEEWQPENVLIERFEDLLLKATEKRLRADVPVVSYLSGGVDSSTVVALACSHRDTPIPSFTIRIMDPSLDEVNEASIVADHVKSRPVIVEFGADEVLKNYPRLIRAAEAPVVDTSCAALMLLAQEVHRQGYKVALTGEGADEWMAGYPWYKVSKWLGFLDFIPGVSLSMMVRRLYLRLSGAPVYSRAQMRAVQEMVGGHNPWLDIYGMMSLSKLRFFSKEMWDRLDGHSPYADLKPNLDRVRRWHPLNRGGYWAGRIHLAGLLLNAKGDRVAMHSSVEGRYPFLDEDVFSFLAKVPPKFKMKRFTEKYLLRRVAERWLPKSIAWRKKAMFRAPFDSFHLDRVPDYVSQLMSEESLRKTGYFDVAAVQHQREAFKAIKPGRTSRIMIEMGLAGVLATQLWHQTYVDNSLADVPGSRMDFTGNASSRGIGGRVGVPVVSRTLADPV